MSANKSRPVIVDIGFKSRGGNLANSSLLKDLAKSIKGGAKLREALFFAMKDFAPYSGDVLYNHEGLINLPKLPPADMVFLTFVHICEHSYAGKFEKVSWSVAFVYKSVPFVFSLQKFGLRLYHHKDASPSQDLYEEMLRALSKAMDIIGKLMEPVALTQISDGNVTLVNSFHKLDNMFKYFREQAKNSFGENTKPERPGLKNLAEGLSNSFQRNAAGAYNTIAMIDAYFSRLEHLLVILLAFANYDKSKHDLVKATSDLWSDKFKIIFNVEKDSVAKVLFDQLIGLRERLRNPIAHGNFQKNGKSLYFHFSPAGAISCHLSNSEGRAESPFLANKTDYEMACALFDKVDKFLENGSTKYGFLYARSGLNVAYNEESIKKYRAAATNEETFNKFLENESYIADMYTNMDW